MSTKEEKLKAKTLITTKLPYPKNPTKKDKERQFACFLDIFNRFMINIPFSEALEQMPTYDKIMKEILTKKKKYIAKDTIKLEPKCSALVHKMLPAKHKDPGSFAIPITIGNLSIGQSLLYLRASINWMPLSMLEQVDVVEVKPTCMTLHLAGRSIKHHYVIVENMLVKVGKFIFLQILSSWTWQKILTFPSFWENLSCSLTSYN